MRILLYTWFGSYTDDDIEKNLIRMGYDCKRIKNENLQLSDRYKNDVFCDNFAREIKNGTYDCVFTTNFHPLIAKVCHEKDVPYVAWSYDSPPNLPNTRYMDFPTNHIYFFSRDDVEDFRAQGINTVHYMPLAVDTDKWDRIKVSEIHAKKYKADISLVGSLYSSTLPALMNMMSEEQRFFFDKLSDMQLASYERYFLKEFISDGIAHEVCMTIAKNNPDGVQPTAKQLIYSVASYVTNLDRLFLLRVLSRKYDTHLYTGKITEDEKKMLEHVKVHGTVDYSTEMPLVFKCSGINLCPTFRGNTSGIPLRVLDVMGCRSFVLTPYRADLEEYFVEGKEVVTYRSPEEALDKSDYYLAHESERERIATAGYDKVKKMFSYNNCLQRLLMAVTD